MEGTDSGLCKIARFIISGAKTLVLLPQNLLMWNYIYAYVYIYIEGPVDSWRKILNLNVLGLSICTKEVIESMNERGVAGHIIHINRSVTPKIYSFTCLCYKVALSE